jgi:hypothetical protein
MRGIAGESIYPRPIETQIQVSFPFLASRGLLVLVAEGTAPR